MSKPLSLLQRRPAGFTLIELMVTVAIGAVLMMVAAPSFIGFQRNSEMTSLTNALLAAANTARAEAMKTGMNALVVPSGNGSDWTAGWVVFVDKNRDNAYSATADTTVLVQGATPSYITITGTGNAAISPASYIMFDSSGYAKSYGSSPGVANLTLSIVRSDVPSAQADAETRRIVVALTGRVRSCRPSTDSACTSSATN